MEKALQLKCNKKLIQNHIVATTGTMKYTIYRVVSILFFIGKPVTLRDLTNIQTQLRSKLGSSNSLQKVMTHLKEDPMVTLEVFADQDKNLMGIFYQDNNMKQLYAAFPEILFVDATHKVNELRMPLYIFLICDGNGQSEIVAAILVASEQKAVIEQMVRIFKSHNTSWPATKVIMTDKDMNERDTLSEEFPDAALQLCLFHVLRTFGREITTEAMTIRSAERSLVLDLLQKLAYSKSEEMYEVNRKQLNDTGFTRVTEYFESNWHPIRHEWVTCFIKSFNFNTRTNNRLESINQKIKSVCSAFSDLQTFFRDFRAVLSCLRIERDHKVLNCTSKVSVFGVGSSVEAQYTRMLTPYAAKFVREQYGKRLKVKVVDGRVTKADTTADACSCTFHQGMKLPCKHIFAYREYHHQPLFDEDLTHGRWHLSNYKKAHDISSELGCQGSENSGIIVTSNEVQQPKPKTQHQKFKAAHALTLRIATIISEAGTKDFNTKMADTKKLLQYWENGISVEIIEKESTSNGKEINEDSEISDDDASDDHFANDIDDDVSRMSTEIEGKVDESTSDRIANCLGEEPGYSGWSESLAEGRQDVIDDDEYDEAIELVMQDEATTENDENESAISLIKVPPKMQKRGRPKGSTKTVIGLPRKKPKVGPVAFENMLPEEKEKLLLSWFVGADEALEAITGRKITEDQVETIPENVNNACIDESVCIQTIKRFFTEDAWQMVLAILKIKQEGCTYFCPVCQLEIDDYTDDSIHCNSCLSWIHFRCTGLKKSPKKKQWFCRACNYIASSLNK